MSFTRKFHTFIKKPHQNIVMKISDSCIEMQNFNSNFDLISSKKIIDGKYSFVETWFDINNDNTIYGVINAEKNSLMHLYINDKVIIKNTLLTYDADLFTIQFPYIKCINSSTHIIYYLINHNDSTKCTLTHYYKAKDSWNKNKIDILGYNILTNFVMLFENSTPIIFYLKIVNGYEELFSSTFNLTNKTWSEPNQITNSRKFKVYLSAILCNDGIYHITYSENNSNKYYCRYIKIYFNKNKLTVLKDTIISETFACTFPNILQYNKTLHIHWIENYSLHYCISYDSGENWNSPAWDQNSSTHPFNCYIYKSNNSNNEQFNCYALFLYDNSLNILGIKDK
jgi:hypothetical protein